MSILCWIVTDGQTGPENQCLGVANALGITPVVKRIALRQPWKALTPFLAGESEWTFLPIGDPLLPPWPDLVLASGRKAVAAARYIKRMAGGKTLTVFIQNPHTPSSQFDMISVPLHDRLRGPNVIVTTASPTRITSDRLDDAREYFADLFGDMPTPRAAVIIGGDSRFCHISNAGAEKLAAQLHRLATEKNVSLMVRMSPKTPPHAERTIEEALTEDQNAWIWDPQTENPYLGFLAWADYILVTGDNVSLISEAAATGKPVYMIPVEGCSSRIHAFQKNMMDRGIARIFDGSLENWIYAPLNDAALIAEEIKKRLKSGVSL